MAERFNFFDIANAYRESVEGGLTGSPRTGSGELEAAKAAGRDRLEALKQAQAQSEQMAAYLAMTPMPFTAGDGKGGALFSNLPNGSGLGGSVAANRKLGQELAAKMGWSGALWDAYDKLVMKESGWKNTAQNPTSTAYGIGQFLDSTWKGYGPKTSDPRLQIQYMLQYIKNRYGDPSKALQFHLKNNWY